MIPLEEHFDPDLLRLYSAGRAWSRSPYSYFHRKSLRGHWSCCMNHWITIGYDWYGTSIIYREGKEIHVTISKQQYTSKRNKVANRIQSNSQPHSPKIHDRQENQIKPNEIPSKWHNQQPLIQAQRKTKWKPAEYHPIRHTPKTHEPIRKPTVYTTSQRRFINRVNAVDCSQQRTHQTEARGQPPAESGAACGNTRRTGFGISPSQASFSIVEKSSSCTINTILSRGKERGSLQDLYNRPMNLTPGRPNRLTPINFGRQIVPCDHRKSRIWRVSSSSLRCLTLLVT